MRKKLNKQARVRFVWLFVTLILAITVFFIKYTVEKPENRTGYIGNIAIEVFAANAKGQKALEYIDGAASVSESDASAELSMNGGFVDESQCKKFGGFNLWRTEDKDCTPASVKGNYLRLFASNFYSYLDYYPLLPLELDYSFMISKDRVLATSNSMLEVPLFKFDAQELGYCQTGREPRLFLPFLNRPMQIRDDPAFSAESDVDYAGFWPTPNCRIADERVIDTIVIHYTAGVSCDSDTSTMQDPMHKASAHYLICRDGSIRQLVADKDIAWHAGCEGTCSRTGSCTGECLLNDHMNTRSIGIELANRGYLGDNYQLKPTSTSNLVYTSNYGLVRKVVPQGYTDPVSVSSVEIAGEGPLEYEFIDNAGKPPKGTVLRSIEHKYWEEFTPEQYETLAKLTSMIATKYSVNSDRIIGHEQVIARKSDPGPAFNWTRLRDSIIIDDSYDKNMPQVELPKPKNQEEAEKFQMSDFGEILLNPTTATELNMDFDIFSGINKTLYDIEKACQLDEDCWSAYVADPANKVEEDYDWIISRQNKVITKENGEFEIGKWKEYCETPNEQVLNHIAGAYQDCKLSPTSECYCTLLPEDESQGGIPFSEFSKYVLKGRKSQDGLVQLRLAETTQGGSPKLPIIELNMSEGLYPTHFEIRNWGLLVDETEVILEDDDKKNEHTLDFKDLVLHKSPTTMRFAKKAGSILNFLNGTRVSAPDLCAPSNIFKFCLVNKKQNLHYHDQSMDKTVQKNQTIRFATYLVDKTPPQRLDGVNAYNKDNDEHSIILEWKKSQAGDFSHYHIYCSESSFAESVENSMPQSKVFNNTDDDVLKVEITSCNNAKIIDEKTYYFAVTPVDISGNENTQVIEASAASSDNLSPGIINLRIKNSLKRGAGFIDFNGAQDEAIILWDPLTLNHDNSAINDLQGYLAMYFDNTLQWNPTSLPRVQISTCTLADSCDFLGTQSSQINVSHLNASKNYRIVVLGVDDDNNFLTNIEDEYIDTYVPEIGLHRIENFSITQTRP